MAEISADQPGGGVNYACRDLVEGISKIKSLKSFSVEARISCIQPGFNITKKALQGFCGLEDYAIGYDPECNLRVNFRASPNIESLKSLSLYGKGFPENKLFWRDEIWRIRNDKAGDMLGGAGYKDLKALQFLEKFSLVLPERKPGVHNLRGDIVLGITEHLHFLKNARSLRLENIILIPGDYDNWSKISLPKMEEVYLSSTTQYALNEVNEEMSEFNPFPNLRHMTGDANTVKWLADSAAGIELYNKGCEFIIIGQGPYRPKAVI
ncbi:hypothetical protein [Paraburkholderia bonniea]|uniref:hypothetical protein n=1 Tax=Paraburkholderia bonniea TaxID=2152891 RepID=UPI0012919196|nr:hypothetical protein [Paraburkholderia bonniea]